MDIKDGDVFRFAYNEDEMKKRFMPYHCFDGKLIARHVNGEIYLEDTYWGACSDNRRGTPEQWQQLGELVYLCNLNDVAEVREPYIYYDDSDIFDLSQQHGCYKNVVVRKGAVRSKEKMLASINERIDGSKRDIERAQDRITRLIRSKLEVESGNTEVYIPT